MIRGIVTDCLEAVVRLTVIGPGGRRRTIQAVVDTGFDGYLSLPAAVIARLNLPWHKRGRVLLADGRDSLFDVFQAGVLWDNRRLQIFVDEAETEPLLGMALLEGHKLSVEVRNKGRVIIRRLRA